MAATQAPWKQCASISAPAAWTPILRASSGSSGAATTCSASGVTTRSACSKPRGVAAAADSAAAQARARASVGWLLSGPERAASGVGPVVRRRISRRLRGPPGRWWWRTGRRPGLRWRGSSAVRSAQRPDGGGRAAGDPSRGRSASARRPGRRRSARLAARSAAAGCGASVIGRGGVRSRRRDRRLAPSAWCWCPAAPSGTASEAVCCSAGPRPGAVGRRRRSPRHRNPVAKRDPAPRPGHPRRRVRAGLGQPGPGVGPSDSELRVPCHDRPPLSRAVSRS